MRAEGEMKWMRHKERAELCAVRCSRPVGTGDEALLERLQSSKRS
jgi:hypothetical protein